MVSGAMGEQVLRMPRPFPELAEDDSESDLPGFESCDAAYPSGHGANILLLTTIVRPTYSVYSRFSQLDRSVRDNA